MTANDIAAARATPGRCVSLDELSYADRLREAFRGIKAAAVEHGVGHEVAAAIAYFEVVERNPPTPSNAPSTAWMEAVAREAAGYVLTHWQGESDAIPEVEQEAIVHAMRTPPPAGPGGPNG